MQKEKFEELDRSALTQLGVNFLNTGAGKFAGNTNTGKFGGTRIGGISDTFPRPPVTPPFSSTETINDLLNVFLFRPDIHLGAVIRALQTRNLLQILAEPNLIAVNGKESSFLAGGEVPLSLVQPGEGFIPGSISF